MIYVFLADGFEEIEALTPVDMLRRAGADVKTVCIYPDREDRVVMGSHKIPVTADLTAAEADEIPAELEMVILPGGMPGSKNLDESALVDKYLRYAADKGLYTAAICAAPMVLGRRGLLAGKRAVCYPGFEKELKGAVVTESAVEVDGNMITACGMGAAVKFGGALVRLMKGEDEEKAMLGAILADRV
ncbi:MAG: DJ-1/PfpI family protein [Clostridia bacterium]|nr:DJ-1/PfpI family protein [Clostridia bacterium]